MTYPIIGFFKSAYLAFLYFTTLLLSYSVKWLLIWVALGLKSFSLLWCCKLFRAAPRGHSPPSPHPPKQVLITMQLETMASSTLNWSCTPSGNSTITHLEHPSFWLKIPQSVFIVYKMRGSLESKNSTGSGIQRSAFKLLGLETSVFTTTPQICPYYYLKFFISHTSCQSQWSFFVFLF